MEVLRPGRSQVQNFGIGVEGLVAVSVSVLRKNVSARPRSQNSGLDFDPEAEILVSKYRSRCRSLTPGFGRGLSALSVSSLGLEALVYLSITGRCYGDGVADEAEDTQRQHDVDFGNHLVLDVAAFDQ